ncbi:MAG TPA: hypothetical protein VK362_08350 [Reyranella sp.]|nr:hypothetical protein [Reyranella sp.]
MGAGCAQGVPQYNVYVLAFNAQYEQGDSVLDIVGQAERAVGSRQLNPAVFDPDSSAYYLDTVDPPITASFRASLKSLKTYNEALVGLTNGEAANVLVARISVLANTTAAGVSAGSVALGGPAAVVGAEGIVIATTGALKIAEPIFKSAATAASREAFRQELIRAYPEMRMLLVELRKATAPMYQIMRRSLVVRGSDETDTGRSPDAERVLANKRQLLAGWVLLMDKSLLALDQAVAAAKSSDSSARAAGLTDASIELKVFAEQMKAIRLKQ